MQLLREKGIPLVGVYADEAVSGTKLTRQNYDRMMADLQEGLADTLVIYDQSRLMRDVAGWFGARNALEVLGVRVYSATQEYVGGNINKPDVFMMEAIQSVFDTMHVLTTKEKVREKMHYMAKNGLHTGGKPALGYRAVGEKQKRLVVDEAEARIVRRIFEEYAAGKSYRLIIEGLNRDGYKTKSGNAFGTNSLHDLLKNPLYTGRVIYGAKVYRADGSRNTHAPEGEDVIERQDDDLRIIPQELFEAVRKKMVQNVHQKPGRPASARDYPLKGKVFCGECGSAMAVATSKVKGNTYFYYRCPKKDRTHDCTARPIRCDELENLVVDQVRTLIGCADIRDRALGYLKDYAEKINQTGLDRYHKLADELAEVNGKIERIIDAIEDGNYIPAMKQRLTSLEEQKQAIQQRIDELTRAAKMAALPADRLEAIFQKLCTAAQQDTTAVLSIVSRVEVYNDHVKIYTAFDPDPKKTKYEIDGDEVCYNIGDGSGVPGIIINLTGLVISVQRKR